jgi:competence protein ComEC
MGEAPLPQHARSYWKTRFSAIHEELEKFLEAERAQLPPWFAVGFGSGIAAWFALDTRAEWQAFLCLATALCLAGFGLGQGRAGRATGWFALAALLGCSLVWARSEWIAQPRLDRPVVVDLAGTVGTVDHLAARDKVRLLVEPADSALPPRVRVTIDEDKFPPGIAPGARIRVRARLAPPPPMALPGTYDFARDAWFQGIGAVGKTLGDVSVVQPASPLSCSSPPLLLLERGSDTRC